jgi:hypothetical protein
MRSTCCLCPCILSPLLSNSLVHTFRRQLIHTQQYKNGWTRRFLCDPCRVKGKEAISSPQKQLLMLSLTNSMKKLHLDCGCNSITYFTVWKRRRLDFTPKAQ